MYDSNNPIGEKHVIQVVIAFMLLIFADTGKYYINSADIL